MLPPCISYPAELTDWAARDLTPAQLEYAALDAAVTPKLMEKVLESVHAFVSVDHLLEEESIEDGQPERNNKSSATPKLHGPVIRRWEGDNALVEEIVSYRFLILPGSVDGSTIREFQAKQIVGPSWISTKTWTATESLPTKHAFSS